jgi:hypothetical protein
VISIGVRHTYRTCTRVGHQSQANSAQLDRPRTSLTLRLSTGVYMVENVCYCRENEQPVRHQLCGGNLHKVNQWWTHYGSTECTCCYETPNKKQHVCVRYTLCGGGCGGGAATNAHHLCLHYRRAVCVCACPAAAEHGPYFMASLLEHVKLLFSVASGEQRWPWYGHIKKKHYVRMMHLHV